MTASQQKGWIMVLSNTEESSWGSVEDFYESLTENPIRGGMICVESDVWGRLQKKDHQPRPGDGIAFYHSQRARFPKGDAYGRKPRVSAIGTIRKLGREGQDVDWLSAHIPLKSLLRLSCSPVVRQGANGALFEKCGMVQGAVATFFEVPAGVWGQLKSLAGVE